ncbi:MAG TPA: bifunctional 2-C-methyl-D-erythritol 4-phosphate cytidylyltransferase/2-C-methyl-D-erythritol 2,4-cyclodiphosphate synthase, partial [Paracoccaceae bacterium]|nr:bifunctional 2-C-methyl-D-erythritol 4-phosphate cytidylyltransferase/2-C-methyl-D-erythritol 2,4-cyclodiphosphate synthase [Paracoccaceae bacterium]
RQQMQIAAIVVAAGQGTRFGGPIPKQYLDLAGEPVLTRTLRALLAVPIDAVLVAIHQDARADYERAAAPLADKRLLPAVTGGATRADSVRNALEALSPHAPARVLIHDGARPFISPERIAALIAAEGAAILAEPVVDALWREDAGHADAPVARAGLWRAQTPQYFPYQQLLEAHRAEAATGGKPALDDAETYRRAGHQVALIEGNAENFKITTSDDLARAERILLPAFETRTGQGFDVHRFAPGDHLWLCGVRIPHDQQLEGHSDADIGLHALSDAIYGALADGDIGRHFPPSDPQWKGAESHIFLSHAAGLVRARGGRIIHAEVTLMAEAPKIAPHADAMRARLAEIMGLAVSRIGVKATTMERMGFVGRGEGLAALASATIELPREHL